MALDQKKLLQFAQEADQKKKQNAQQTLQQVVTGGSGSGTPSYRTPASPSAPKNQGTMSWGDFNRYHNDFSTWSTTGQHAADYGTWSTPQGNDAYQLIANRAKNGAQVALIGDQYYAMDKGKYNQYEQDYNYWTRTHKHMPGFEQWSSDSDLETWRTIRDYNYGVRSGQNPSMELQGFINGLDPQALEATRTAYQKEWVYDITDAEDMARKEQGLPPKNKDKYYGKSELDRWLYSQGLPSTKSNYFAKQYQAQADAMAKKRAEWADQPIYDFHSNEQQQAVGKALAEYWKSTWTYSNSAEDKQRQREGKPPKALDKLYTESEIDQYYKALGLPPASEIDSYVAGFDTAKDAYNGLIDEYFQRKNSAPWEDSRTILEGIMQDDKDGVYREIISGMGLDEKDLTGLEGDDLLSAYLGTGKKKTAKSSGPFALSIDKLESMYDEAYSAAYKAEYGRDYAKGDSLYDYVTGSAGDGLDAKTFDFVTGSEDLGYEELSKRIGMIDLIRQEIEQPMSLADWTAEHGDTLEDADDAVNAYNRYKEEWKRNHPLDDDLQEQRRKLFLERKKYAREKGRELDAESDARRAEQAALLGSLWGASPEFVQKWSAGGKYGSVSNAELNALTGQGSVYKTTSDALQTEYESILAADKDPNGDRRKAIEARTSELMQQMLSTWAAQDAQRRIEQFQNDPDWETIRAQVQSMADAGWERFEIEDQFPRDIEQAALDDVYGPEDTGEYVPSEADRKLAESEARKRAELEYPSDAEDAAIGLDAWSWIMNPKAQVYKETANASSEYTELFPYMTDEQIKEFARIAQDEGAVAAGRYWKEIRPELEKAKAELASEGVQYDAEGRPLVASLESALLSLPAGIEGIGVELAALKGDYRENDWRGTIGRRKSGLQQTVSFNIRENNGALASFLYDTTMSMADSLQSMALGDVGLAITGFRAAADTVNEYIERGADPRTAGIMGGIAWAAEFITEKMDMDRLFEMKNDGTFSGLLKSVFIGSGLPEAAEEGVSEIADIIGDTFMMADQSEFLQTMSKFEAEGASTPNAFWKTLYSYAGARIGMAMAGGFVSGVVMGAGFTAAHGGKIAQESGYSWLRFQKGFKILNEYDQALQHGKAFEGSMQRVYSDITASGISPSAQVAAASVFQTAAQTPSEFTSESAMKAVQKLQEMIQKAIERNNIYGAETAEARTKSQNRLMDLMTGIQTAYQNAGAALQSRNLEAHTQFLNEMRGLINEYNRSFSESWAAMRTRATRHEADVAQQERDVQAATTTAQAGMQQAGDEMAKKLLTDGAILVDENGQTVQVDDETLAKIRSGEIDVNELIRQSGETANIGVARRWMGYNQQAPEQSAADWARGIMDPNGYWAKKPRNQALKALQREYQNRNEALRSQYDQAVAEGRSSDASRIREDMRVLSQQYESAQASILSGEAGIGAVSTAEQATGPNVMKGARLETEADKAAGGTQAETTTETQTETQMETAPETAPQNDGYVTESARAAQERAEVEADRAQVETEEQARIREDYESQMAEFEQELQDAVDNGDAEQQNLIEETIDALQDEFDRKYKAAAETNAATDTTTGTETETQTDTETEEKTDGKQDAYPTREYEQENGPSDRTSAGNGSSQSGYAGPSGQAQAYQGVDEQTFKRDTGNAARQWTLTTKSGSIPTFERATPSAQTAQIINNMRRPGGPVVSTYARQNNMPAAFNSTGTRDGNIYVGITGDDGYDSINVPFQIGHELSEGDAGLRAVGNAVLKRLPRQQVRNLVDNYMAVLNEDTDGDVKFPGYANAAKEMICDIHGALRAIEQNPNLDIETVFTSLGIDPEVGLAVANAMVDALSDEASTQVPGTTGAELAQQYREAYKAGVLEPETVAEQLAYLNDSDSDGVVKTNGMAENSVRGLANGINLNVMENKWIPGSYIFTDQNGRVISHVTSGMIKGSPIGTLIDLSLAKNYISEAEAQRQYDLFAAVANLLIKCDGDFAKAQMFMGSELFTAMKTNSDKQYSFTWDFVSICTKTQAVIDAMSRRMVEKGRGLTDDEILAAYKAVNEIGQPVPCPECYVFSRWVGIGSLLDNIATYQNRYRNMVEIRNGKMYATQEAINEYNETKQAVAAAAEAAGINPGKAKSKLADKAQKAMDKAEKALREAASVQDVTDKELAPLKEKYDKCRDAYEKIKSLVWVEKVFFKNIGTGEVYSKNVNGEIVQDFAAPDDVLFDLNKGGEFARDYPRTWAFRTTQGAGYGKAITPYSEGRAGEGVMVIGKGDAYIKAKQSGKAINFFERLVDGRLSADGMKVYNSAVSKQLQQAWLGGQRWQSTSDARFENALDYLVAALDTQAMGAYAQSYTKVSEAVEMFAKLGLFPNQSMMPFGNGLDMDENGNVRKDKDGNDLPKDTSVGGMRPEEAQANRLKYPGAGTITIGVNDRHIRALMHQAWRDFIIPYHASGGKADLIAEFRSTQDRGSKAAKARSSDYTRVQGEKVLSDAALRYLLKHDRGITDEAEIARRIEQIHRTRKCREAILMKKSVREYADILESNRIIRRLYDRINSAEWKDLKGLPKGKIAEQIYPNEYWDQTTTYETSGQITKDYLEYCDSLGFLHKFAGVAPVSANKEAAAAGYTSMLRPVMGYNERGEQVPLQDLAYVYDENGNKTDQIEDYFWKVLTDRQMYFANADENGQHPYQPQRRVTLGLVDQNVIENFAKVDQSSGKRYYNRDISARNAERFAKADDDAIGAILNGTRNTPLAQQLQRGGGYLMDAVMNPGGQTQSEGQTEFSMRSPVERVRDLVAVHNINAENLSRAIDNGGFPMPSIAVTKVNLGNEGYADISVVFGSDTIDPSRTGNRVYNGDAFTATYPEGRYTADEGVMKKIGNKAKKLRKYKSLGWNYDNAVRYLEKFSDKESTEEYFSDPYNGSFLIPKHEFSAPLIIAYALEKHGPEWIQKAYESESLKNFHKSVTRSVANPDVVSQQILAVAIANKGEFSSYVKWVHDLFDGILGDQQKTIDLNGERVPMTLDNIVDYMINQGKTEKQKELRTTQYAGVINAVKTFDTLDEIIGNEGSLQQLRGTKVDDALNAFAEQYQEIEAAASPDEGNFAPTNAAILDALQENTEGDMLRVLNERNDAEHLNLTDPAKTAHDLYEYKERLNREYPRNYFEAKPERVVGLNEIRYVVMPETRYPELLAKLNENGIPTYGYNPTVKGDRTRVLNASPEASAAKFSSRSLNITPEQDAAYMDAVNSGDMETAQRMVDEAARRAGYSTELWHGTKERFTVFDLDRSQSGQSGYGIYFGKEDLARQFGEEGMHRFYIDSSKIGTSGTHKITAEQFENAINRIGLDPAKTYKQYADTAESYVSHQNDYSLACALQSWAGGRYYYKNGEEMKPSEFLRILRETLDLDGIEHSGRTRDNYELVIWDPTLAKLADPVTRRDDGSVIPLSERFNESSEDVRYSSRGLSPAAMVHRIDVLEGMVERRDQKLVDQKREANARLKQARERYRVEKGREQVTARAKQLYDWLQRPTKKEHVPIPLQGYVAGILENLDIGISERGNADTRAFRDAVSGLKQFYTDYVTGAQNRYDFAGFQTTVPPEIFQALDTIERGMEGMPRLGTMNANQVEALKKVLGQVRKDTMLANSMMRNKRYKTVAAIGEQTQKDADAKGTRKIWKLKSVQDLLTTRMMDAFSWAKAVGKGAESVIDELESGMEKSYARIHEGAEWSEKTLRENGVKKKDIRKWGRDAVQVTFENGKTGRFTTAQIMEVYALSKRPQARAHMLTGGIEIADMKNGHRQTDRYVLTETDLNAIIEKLTPQQRKLIDAMQQYLSTDVAEWGNETWRALYDYEMFGEENYWPIKSAARGVKTQDPEAANVINALLNMGMTKLTVPNASNPLTINDAFDTWTGHVAQMARLNGLAIPIEDALKWYNWVGSNEDGTRNYDVATKAAVDKVLGPEGSRYFLKLLKDINGLSTGDAGTQFASELMSKYKKAAVAGKLRVVVQQPTAIIRSWTLINPKYFANQTAGQIKKNVAEMQEHSSLAWWKSQGNYDVGTGKSLKSVFFGTDNVLDDITDVAMKPAGWADDFAWSWLWSAVKAETKAEHPELQQGSDAYWEHVNTRFADIVNQTQVVDGILQRSDLMRSKNGLDQMASAFMAEPTKAYNMIRNRLMALVEQAKTDGVKSIFVDRKLGGELIRALIAFVISIAANSAVLAAHDSFKKRNKGDRFSTAFNENFWTNVRNDVKPWDYVPYIKDVASIMSGDSVDRMDMSMIEDVYRAVQNGYKYFAGTGSKTGYKVASDLVSVAGAMAGVPTTGLIATMETVTNGIAPGSIKKNAYLDAKDRAALRDAGISYDDGYGIAAQYRTHSWSEKSASTNAEKAVYLLKAADTIGASYTDKQFDILSEMLGMNENSYDPKKDGSFGKWARKNVDKYVADKKKKGGLTDEVKERYDGYGDILSELGY